MRTKHTPHPLPAFPVYCAGFLAPDVFVVGGGGGASRSGIKNKLRLYKIDGDKIELLNELELGKNEDVPMSIAVHPEAGVPTSTTKQLFTPLTIYPTQTHQIVTGVNSATELLEKGENQNCRIFDVTDNVIAPGITRQTIRSVNAEDYQKVTSFSPKFDLVAVGSTDNELNVLSFPSLTPSYSPVSIPAGDLSDAAFSASSLLVVSSAALYLFDLTTASSSPKGKGKEVVSSLNLAKTIERPTLPGQGESQSTFRAARFHPADPKIAYTIVNTTPPRTTQGKKITRKSYVCKWDTETWEVVKVRKIADSSVTCFDISPNGKLLAYGSSEYTIGVLDAHTFAPLINILHAHKFPPTVVRFNPTTTLLVSGSADNSVRVVEIPQSFGGQSWTIVLFILAVLIAILAYAAQDYWHPGATI